MSQFLPRGFQISTEKRITRMIAEGPGWQIYLTNLDSYALAVNNELYESWVANYSLPSGIFMDSNLTSYRVFASTGDYIISSLEKGPYPENNGQVETFSIAFKTTLDLFNSVDIHDAIYIEEYSLILPVSPEKKELDNAAVYGRWLTGGINISIRSLKRVSSIMSWLPKNALERSVQLAGFEVPQNTDEETVEGQEAETTIIPDKKGVEVSFNKEDQFKLIGRPELERFFNDSIIDIVLHQEQYRRMGIDFPGATILYGPPGCGKTYAVERLAEFLGWQRFDIDSSTIASSYIHETSKKISEVFGAAIKAAPSILVIDEMEAFLTDRGMAGPSGIHHIEEVSEFLRRIPEAIAKGVLVFAMTNMIESIDPAILRRGRFDHIVEVKMANAEEIEALLKSKFSELPVNEAVDASVIAKWLEGHPMSDVAFVLREAGRFAVKKNISVMDMDCFSDAIHLLPPKKDKLTIGFVKS